jgi:hypothetical protein
MQNFMKQSALGLLTVAAAAALGYFALIPPTATASLPAAGEIASHNADCKVCRLPLYGRGDAASKFGRDSSASADVSEVTHVGTIRK